MQYKPTRSLCATVAIAATLALGSIPAFAQEAAPAVSVPPAAPAPVVAASPPAAAAPTIAVPPVTVQPTAPQPEAAAAEPVAAAARAPARAEPAPRRVAAPSASAPAPTAAAPAPAAVAAAEVAPAAPTGSALDTPLAAAAPAPVAEAPAAEADSGLTGEEAGFLALLAAIGIGGIAFLVMGRRRRRMASAIETDDYAPTPVAAAASLRQPTVMTETPVRADPVYAVADHPAQPAVASRPAAAPQSAPAFAMGRQPTGDDRQDLLDRMVAAAPDETNPFTSRKARRRRARLLLQAREDAQRSDAATKPFDWRSYEPLRRREPELMPA